MNASANRPASAKAMGRPWKGCGTRAYSMLLARARHQEQREREARARADGQRQRVERPGGGLRVEQRHGQDDAVGGDEHQVDAPLAVQHRVGLAQHGVEELHHEGHHPDEHDDLQEAELERAQHEGVQRPRGHGGEDHHQREGDAHADRRVALLRDPEEDAEPEVAGEDEVVDERGREHHGQQQRPGRGPHLVRAAAGRPARAGSARRA